MFSKFLLDKYLEWQGKAGARKSVVEFASYLGYPQPTVSAWMNGNRTPRDEGTVRQLAVKLGIETYDILGLERPDARLFFIMQHWGELTDEQQARLLEEAEEYAKNHDGAKVRKPKPT